MEEAKIAADTVDSNKNYVGVCDNGNEWFRRHQ